VLDDDLHSPLRRHWPIWSEDRMLGRFCANTTVCVSCHPQGCPGVDCHGFTANDVAEGHVGRSCDRCGESLSGQERRDAS
jgi:hypothetical protein